MLFLALALSSCRHSGNRSHPGYLDIHWTGTDRGKLAGATSADWCSSLRLLEIQYVSGDTGTAIAIYPSDTIVQGTYRIQSPVKAKSLRPSAGFALRWTGPTFTRGFRGESGAVVVQRSPNGALSGRLSAAARSATDTGFIQITGTFRDLVIRAPVRGCADTDAEPDAPSTDTLVH